MKNKKFLNTTIYGLAVLLILIIVFIGKTIYDIDSINNAIFQKRVLLEKQYRQGLSLKDAIKEMDKIDEEFNKLDNIVIDSKKTLEFIKELETLADKNNLKQNINISDFDKPTMITPIPITLRINGQYKNILQYINDLDRKKFYVNLNIINITNNSSEDSYGSNVVAQLTGKIYIK